MSRPRLGGFNEGLGVATETLAAHQSEPSAHSMFKRFVHSRGNSRALGAAAAVLLAWAGAAVAAPAGPVNPLPAAGLVCASHDGVTCFDTATGAVAWQALAGRQTLELAPAPGIALVAGSDGVQALELASGARRWQLSRFGSAFPAQSDGERAWFGTRSGHVVMLEAASGALIWSVDLGDWVYTPALAGGRLVTGGRDARLYALDPASGALAWDRPLEQELVYRPVRAGADSVLVGTFDGLVRRVAAADGQTLWTARGPTPAYRFAVASGRAFALRMGGVLEALDLETGRTLWRYQSPRGELTGLTARSQQIWVAEATGRLLTLDATSGELLAHRDLGGPLVGAPHLTPGGVLAVTATPLTLHALGDVPATPPTKP